MDIVYYYTRFYDIIVKYVAMSSEISALNDVLNNIVPLSIIIYGKPVFMKHVKVTPRYLINT
jgi:hypothetical protein